MQALSNFDALDFAAPHFENFNWPLRTKAFLFDWLVNGPCNDKGDGLAGTSPAPALIARHKDSLDTMIERTP